jgi:hypothetical protein
MVDVFKPTGMLGQRDLMEPRCSTSSSCATPHAPAQPVDFLTEGSIFHAIRDIKHLMVHRSFESLQQSVERSARGRRRSGSSGDRSPA